MSVGATPARVLAQSWLENYLEAPQPLDILFSHPPDDVSPEDVRLARRIVRLAIRHRRGLEWRIGAHLSRPGQRLSVPVQAALLSAGAQLEHLGERVPPRAAVHQAVEVVRSGPQPRLAGFVNAVLRSYLREPERGAFPTLEQDPVGCIGVASGLPSWLAERWVDRYGAGDAAGLAQAMRRDPGLCLWLSPAAGSQDEYTARLEELGATGRAGTLSRRALWVEGVAVRDLPGFDAGHVSVQDEAAQVVGALVAPKAGERVLDVCAAPGGKTIQLASEGGGEAEILAWDRSLERLETLQANLERMGLRQRVAVRRRNLLKTPPLEEECGTFDAVLLDAPCSGLGVIRRHPELPELRAYDAPDQCARRQWDLLQLSASLVAPGGRLVYAVCSLEPEEGEGLIRAFARDEGWGVAPCPETMTPADLHGRACGGTLSPNEHGTDGFYAATLIRAG